MINAYNDAANDDLSGAIILPSGVQIIAGALMIDGQVEFAHPTSIEASGLTTIGAATNASDVFGDWGIGLNFDRGLAIVQLEALTNISFPMLKTVYGPITMALDSSLKHIEFLYYYYYWFALPSHIGASLIVLVYILYLFSLPLWPGRLSSIVLPIIPSSIHI